MEIDLTIDKGNISGSFERIAKELLNSWVIASGNSFYRICEIEFYFKTKDHEDPYSHGHELQKSSGKWYLHPSGMDITFGNPECYGGILIRALDNLTLPIDHSKRYTYGPLNCLQELFQNLNSVYKQDYTLGIVYADEGKIEYEDPIAAPRVGLNPNKNPEMFDQNYRFLVLPKKKHADKTLIFEAMIRQGLPKEKADKIWG